MDMIELADVGFRYNTNWILRHISFTVGKGEFIGIIGPNGSGKTTLLKITDALLNPQEGEAKICGIPGRRFKRMALARLVAVVPQDAEMIFPFTVQEVVLMGRAPHLGKLRFEGEKDFQIAEEAMKATDTLLLMNRNMNALSGGERQRVLIARALAQEPQIMLLDEPTALLDIRHQMEFFDLIKQLNRDRALTVIAVTHDINLASNYCDRIILLKSGHIYRMGSPCEVIAEGYIRDVYEANVAVDQNPVTGRPRVTLLSSFLSDGGSRLDSGAAPQL
jgi:iron complex transport system ATP-binding protein